MKKAVTLFLLVLFLLNVVGYYGILVGLRKQTAERFSEGIDRESMGGEMIFKIPLSIPYTSDANEFSPVKGEFEYQGEVFQLVKQKYYRDTLYIVCAKDQQSKKINQALADYVKGFSDKPLTQKQNTKTQQVFSKDFFSTRVELTSTNSGFETTILTSTDPSKSYQFLLTDSIGQPPELVA
jgi:hypothetical protein